MDKKGFVLIQALIGLFFLGLISVTCLPILNTASYHLTLVKDKMDMLFVAESVVEQIQSFDYNCTQEDECLYDKKLLELIESLAEEDSVIVQLPENIENTNYKYLCTIFKENHGSGKGLWKIQVDVSSFEEERRISNVKIMACMQIPKKNDIPKKE